MIHIEKPFLPSRFHLVEKPTFLEEKKLQEPITINFNPPPIPEIKDIQVIAPISKQIPIHPF